ncbi:MAG: DNA-directed RNA polymerase subunit D [Candidatus Aenigmatarchaeota archaeon]
MAIEVEILDKNDRKMIVIISGIDYGMANAIRRIAVSEVPVMAVEYVDFIENSSGFFDEILAHRIGSIPLTSLGTHNVKSECKCSGKGCSRCQVTLALEAEGPRMVKAEDIVSSDDDVRPSDPSIPVVELLTGQRVKLTAVAEYGFGKDHSKWQSSIVGYRCVPSVRIVNKDNASDAIKVCSKGVFGKNDDGVYTSKSMNCDLCMRCAEVTGGAISITPSETDFIFTIESVSSLKPDEILTKSLDILSARAEEFKKLVKSEV